MKPARLILAFVVATIVAGCGGRVPMTHYYVLDTHVVAGNVDRDGWTVGVDPFTVDPPYDQDRIVYRVGDDTAEVGFYAYHRWASPLARMLPRVVADELGDVAGVRTIEPVAFGRKYDARLGGRVLAFEEIDTPEGETVRVVIRLHLLVDDEEVWSKTASGRGEVSAAEVVEVVHQMRSALSEALQGMRPGLQSALRRNAAARW
jgi:ABC-type uncharacterized transport system auxiliary subunit